jgi:predicted acylesterase/phospholipase RssA
MQGSKHARVESVREGDTVGSRAGVSVCGHTVPGEGGEGADAAGEASRLRATVESWARDLRERMTSTDDARDPSQPSLYEVLANSLYIMQVRITRSRMAGEPPDLLITPRLADFALLDLDRGDEAMAEGRRATERALAVAHQP